MASTLSIITITCIIQFFLTQLNQYRLIGGNNKLSEDLRTFAKFFEKDTHNSLEMYVFEDISEALAFVKGSTVVSLPRVGNCALFVTERGVVENGFGVIYYVGSSTIVNGITCFPLIRSYVSFSSERKIVETDETLTKIHLGYLKSDVAGDNFVKNFKDSAGKQGIFYTIDHRRFERNSTNSACPHVAGCRHGIYINTVFVQPGLKGQASETSVNFCFFSRNPRF